MKKYINIVNGNHLVLNYYLVLISITLPIINIGLRNLKYLALVKNDHSIRAIYCLYIIGIFVYFVF